MSDQHLVGLWQVLHRVEVGPVRAGVKRTHGGRKNKVDVELIRPRPYVVPDMPFPYRFPAPVNLADKVRPDTVDALSLRVGGRHYALRLGRRRVAPFFYCLLPALLLPREQQRISVRHAVESMMVKALRTVHLIFPDDFSVSSPVPVRNPRSLRNRRPAFH